MVELTVKEAFEVSKLRMVPRTVSITSKGIASTSVVVIEFIMVKAIGIRKLDSLKVSPLKITFPSSFQNPLSSDLILVEYQVVA